MGNVNVSGSTGENTTRMINMQMQDGEVKVTEMVAERLHENGYVDPDLRVMVDQEEWQATRAVNMFLQDGYHLVHPSKLEELVQEREDQRERINQLQTKVENAVNKNEVKWKRLIEETAQKERENVRQQMLAEQEQKMSQLQAQWLEALSQRDAIDEVISGENAELLEKYQKMLAEQLEVEKAMLRSQMEQEHTKKLQSMESSWRSTLEDEQLSVDTQLQQNQEELEAKWKKILEEAENTYMQEIQAKSSKLEEAELTLSATLKEKDELSSKLEEAQTTLGVTIGNLEEKAMRDRESVEREVEERLRTSAETVAVELGESLQERLEQEKEALRAQLTQEKEEELAAVESTWKATLHDVEERAQKEKDDLQVLLGEGEVLKQRVEAIEQEKLSTLGQLEEEGLLKQAEVEAKWQEIFREATGKAIHVSSVDDAKAVISEIEAEWVAKIEETERKHDDEVRTLQDAHLKAKNDADLLLEEQVNVVNDMQQKLEKLQSRQVDVREQFNTSAEKVENQLRPLRQKEVCTGSRDVALNCYSEHGTQPLRCSQAVKKFMECVDAERIALLRKVGGS